ncbi:MAG: PDGLE domain-containing protein [Candidatus Moraniibacteriota bacterium]
MKKYKWLGLLLASFVVGGVISLGASPSPDGLEYIAGTQGFLELGRVVVWAPMLDYKLFGTQSLAGIAGVGLVFYFLYLIGRLLYSPRLREEKRG